MTESTQSPPPLPPDDTGRQLAVARPGGNEDTLRHVAVAGGTYTILLSGEDTAGRYTLIDMRVPAGGGPPLHRHDFEESFTILDGELEISFRDEVSVLRAGETANVPANAPHSFHNASDRPARLLCICSPAGQDLFFLAVGDLVASATAPPPPLDDDARAARMAKAEQLAPRFRTELLPSP